MLTVLLVGCDGSLKDKYRPIDALDTGTDTADADTDTDTDTGADTDTDTDTGTVDTVVEHCGNIEGNETWAAGYHRLTCDVEVVDGTLTIEAGAAIEAVDNAALVVGDSDYATGLVVSGTESAPVSITAATEDPWSGLAIYGNATASIAWLRVAQAGDERRGAFHVEGTAVAVEHLTVEDAGLCGIKLFEGGSLAAGSTAIRVSGSGGAAVCANLNAVGNLPAVDSDYTGNAYDQVTVSGTDLAASATWSDLGVKYAVVDSFALNGTAELPVVLTLASGVTVAMGDRTSISLSDDAGASGLVATDVLFTALGAETAGSWEGINFESGTLESSSLTNVEIAWAGGDQAAALRIADTEILLDGVDVHDSLSAGIGIEGRGQLAAGSRAIRASSNALPLYAAPNAVGSLPLGELDFDGNTEDLIEMRGDDEVYDSATWSALGWDYRVDTNINLVGTADEPTLITIEPGASLLFTSDHRLEVGDSTAGGLWAVGTASEYIRFLPYDAYTAGSWGGILFYSDTVDSDSAIEYAEIGYAGGSRSRGALQISYSEPSVRDVEIHDSAEYGIYGDCTALSPTGMVYSDNALEDEYFLPC